MEDFSHLERMGRELKCPICLSLLNSSVSLTCNHVFCNSCIEKSMKSASNCPVCKVPFGRREVRPAPHMDNLVNIYKSMEVASGVNIFVTQTGPSTNVPDKLEDVRLCGTQENGRTRQPTPEKQRRFKGKGSKKSFKNTLKNSNPSPEKPSFPAKKRVQVSQYPPLETPMRPAKSDVRNGQIAKDGPENDSVTLKEKLVLNDKGEPVFSPFFWLRDVEDVENLSQQTMEDHCIDTPPKGPSFSDINDSDDEIPSNVAPEGGTHVPLNNGDFFDSEMFEWTQRACSPELCSSPMKLNVADTDEFDEVLETIPSFIDELRTRNAENEDAAHGTDCAEENLPMSSPKTKISNTEDGIKRSNKRGRKASESKQKQRAKRTKHEVLGINVDSKNVSEGIIQEKISGNNGDSLYSKAKICKKDKKVKFDTSSLSAREKPLNQGDEVVVTEVPASLDQKGSSDVIPKSKKHGKRNRKSIDRHLKDSPVSSRTQNLDFASNNITQNQSNKEHVTQSPGISSPVVQDKISDLGMKTRKGKTETTHPKCNREFRGSKMPKISADNITKDKLVDSVQGDQHKVSSKRDKVQRNAHLAEMDKSLPFSNGLVLHKCETVLNKVQCAFCHSTEDSEATGAMVHYLSGKPVTADYSGGSKVIHAHRNCTEWAPNVYFEEDIAMNLEAELARSRRIKCCCCDIKGAALGCYEKSCRKSFHVPCAKLVPQCRWDNENFVMLCPLHATSKLPNKVSGCQVKRKNKCVPKRQSQTHQPQVPAKQVITNSTCSNWISCGSLNNFVLCCSALTNTEKEIVTEFERLSGFRISKNWDSSVTHVIASTDQNGACRRTLKILMGIMEGKWILSIEWIKACMEVMKPVDEERYEVSVDIHGIRDGPRLGRLRLLNKQPKLFDGCEFYFIGDYVPAYKGYLNDLVIAAGGTVLHRKPISVDQNALSPGSSSTSSTFIIYSLELPEKCNPSKRISIFNRRRFDAEALAKSTGAIVASNSWVLNSIAACNFQNLAE